MNAKGFRQPSAIDIVPEMLIETIRKEKARKWQKRRRARNGVNSTE